MSGYNACGECRACCIYLPVIPLEKEAGVACRYLDPAGGCASCTIYSARPSCCQTYKCEWLAEVIPGIRGIVDRPDKSGLIFERKWFTDPVLKREIKLVTVCECKPGAINTIMSYAEKLADLSWNVEWMIGDQFFLGAVSEEEAEAIVRLYKKISADGYVNMVDADGNMEEVKLS